MIFFWCQKNILNKSPRFLHETDFKYSEISTVKQVILPLYNKTSYNMCVVFIAWLYIFRNSYNSVRKLPIKEPTWHSFRLHDSSKISH